MQYLNICMIVAALQIVGVWASLYTFQGNSINPNPHLIGENSAYDCDTVIQVIDNDGRPNTPGASFTSPYTSTGSILVGGVTKSKDMAWALQTNFFPQKDVPTSMPTGCYTATTYSCGTTADLSDPPTGAAGTTTKGAAFIYKAGYQESAYNTAPRIHWQKFFENYQGVTAVALSRSERSLEGAYGRENSWDAGSSQWVFDPQPTPIYTNFGAAFLHSRCLEERSHKIITFDYSTGDLLQSYPWLSRQEVYKHQFLFQYVGASKYISTNQILNNGASPLLTADGNQEQSIYNYAVFVASNQSASMVDQFKIYRYQAIQKSSTAASPADAGTTGSFTTKTATSQWNLNSGCLSGNPTMAQNYLCQGHSFDQIDVTLAKDNPAALTATGSRPQSATQETSFGRHRKLAGVEITDHYQVEELDFGKIWLDNAGGFKYGPQALTQMDKHLYIGGAIRTSVGSGQFCPIVAKVTMTCEDINYKWPDHKGTINGAAGAYDDDNARTCSNYYNANPSARCGTETVTLPNTFSSMQACGACRRDTLANDYGDTSVQPGGCSNFYVRWAYKTLNNCNGASDTHSFAVDVMYADHINDRVYGLMVPRNLAGALQATNYYRLLIFNGNGDESQDLHGTTPQAGHPRFATNCQNRIQIVKVQMESTDTNTYFWRPMGLSLYQEFDRSSQTSEFIKTELRVVFRPLASSESAKLTTNQFGKNNRNGVPGGTAGHVSSTALDVHILSNSISDKLFQCDPSASSIAQLNLPKKNTDSPAGAATFQRQNQGQKAHSVVDDKSPSNIFINDMAFIQPSDRSFVYAGAIISDNTADNPNNKRRGAIFNADGQDSTYNGNQFNLDAGAGPFTDSHGSSLHQLTSMTLGMSVDQYGYTACGGCGTENYGSIRDDVSAGGNWRTTAFTDNTKFDCTSSMRYYKCTDTAQTNAAQNNLGNDCDWYEIPANKKDCSVDQWTGVNSNGFNPLLCCACNGGTTTSNALYNGDSLSSAPFAIDQGAVGATCTGGGAGPCGLFVDEFWDDHSYALKESAQTVEIPWLDYMSNLGHHPSYSRLNPGPGTRPTINWEDKNEFDGCDRTECTLKQYNFLTGACTANYTDATYLFNTDHTDAQKWLIRMKNYTNYNGVSFPYTSWDGTIEINRYAQTEFRIWVCVSCINDFQQVKTMPFMIDVQCSRSSTKLSLPWRLLTKDTTTNPIQGNYNPNRGPGDTIGTNGYNPYPQTIQTFEATIEQNSQEALLLPDSTGATRESIYFEFQPFNSSNPACPIIQYRVKDIYVVNHNHQSSTLNYKYGRSRTNTTCGHGGTCDDFIYEKRREPLNGGTPCTGYTQTVLTSTTNDCDSRLEPKNDNNTVKFLKYNSHITSAADWTARAGVVGQEYSPDDIDQYDDEDQTSLKRNGSMQAWTTSKAYQTGVVNDAKNPHLTYPDDVINYYDPQNFYEVLGYSAWYENFGEGNAQKHREHSIANQKCPYYTGPGQTNLERSTAWPFRKDSQILHVLDCTAYSNNEDNDGTRVTSGKQKLVVDDGSGNARINYCDRPAVPTNTFDVRHERTYKVASNGNFRLYVYDTRIVQEIHFNIEALAEGGRRLEAQNLILNVTCPGHATVHHPNVATHGPNGDFDDNKVLYIGGGGNQQAGVINFAQYKFPAFYPTFEQCNFITGYAIAKSDKDQSYRNQTNVMGNYDLGSVEAPHSMWLTNDLSTDRQPNVRQTIQVDTSCIRTYEYYLLIEVHLTQNTWTDYIYVFSDKNYLTDNVNEPYQIHVRLGLLNDPLVSEYINPDVDYNGTAAVIAAGNQKSPFPNSTYNSTHQYHHVQVYLDEQNLLQQGDTNLEAGVYYYKFEYFWCKNILVEGTGIAANPNNNRTTCNYYNISSSNTAITPIVNYNNDYTLEFDEIRNSYWDADIDRDANGNLIYDKLPDGSNDLTKQVISVYPHRYRHYIKINTTELRNLTNGNSYEFYIYAAYNNDPTPGTLSTGAACPADASSGKYAAFSKKVKIDIVCGLEEVTVGIKEYSYNLPEGTAQEHFGNQTFEVNPQNLTLQTSKQRCPFVKFELFEDRHLTIPWTNTSMIKLYNAENPYSGYIDVKTYEENRETRPTAETWIKHFYLKATTLGGKTNQNDPIHFKITIVERFNDVEVDHAPIFSSHIIHPTIRVWERDLILGNTTEFHYWSPKAVDNEKDPITIRSQYIDFYPYMNLRTFTNDTFYYSIDRAKLNFMDDGRHYYEIKLVDDDILAKSNRKWIRYYFDIVYNDLNPKQYYYFKFSDLEQRKFDFASIKSIDVVCPNNTWTNSTGVKNLCKDIQGSRLNSTLTPLVQYIVERNETIVPVEFLRDADFIRWGFNFTELIAAISTRNYSLSPEIIHETFGTTLVNIQATIPSNYSCHQIDCGSLQTLDYQLTLDDFNKYMIPPLNDSISFIADKLQLTERPMLIDKDPAPDLRPAPSFQGFTTYSNSTIEIKFSEPVQFWDKAANNSEIEKAINSYLMIWIQSGADGSKYLSNDVEEVVYEELNDPTETAECRAYRLKYKISCEYRDIIFQDFYTKKNNVSLENQDIIQNILDLALEEFVVQMVSLAYYMSPAELNHYIEELEPSLSSILYRQKKQDTTSERRALRDFGKKRPVLINPYDDLSQREDQRPEADSLKFRVKYLSTNDSSIWLSLQFEQFENINMGSPQADQLQLKFLDLRFIVSVATLKPVLSDNYRINTIIGQKYFFGILDYWSFYFEDYDSQKYGRTGPHMSFSHIWGQTGLKLLDGSPPPKKVFFENPDYDLENRIFTGTIEWGENTFQNASRWEFRMKFSQDLLIVESGKWVSYDIEDRKISTRYFDEEMLYQIYMNPNYDLYIEDIPPLDPDQDPEQTYDKLMIDFQHKFRILILVFQGLGLAQNLPFRKRSSQSLWSMINAMAILGHTSLFSVYQTPGNVYRQLRYLMNFYNFKPQGSFESFTLRPPYTRAFGEMGYFTTNFLPLQMNGSIISLVAATLCIIVIILRKITKDRYRNRAYRLLGVYLPDRYLFRRLFFRVFVVFYLQILMTSILGLITLDDIKHEFPQKCSKQMESLRLESLRDCEKGLNEFGEPKTGINGLSAVLAVILLTVIIPLTAHMMYIIRTNFNTLQEPEIKEKYGHYYQDLDTSTILKSYFYILFMLRRVILVCIIFFINEGSLQLVLHSGLSFVWLCYLVGAKPLSNWMDNTQEIANEAMIYLLSTIQFSFMYMVNPSEFRSQLEILGGKKIWYYRQYDAGYAFVVFMFFFLFGNLIYVIFSTFLENYRLSSGYIMVWRKIHELEVKLEEEIKFKEMFTTENQRNFMISFEIERQRKVLELRKEANTFHWDKYIRNQEIEYLKKIGVSDAEIMKIFPDYKPRPQKNMYLQEIVESTKSNHNKPTDKAYKQLPQTPKVDMKPKKNISTTHRTMPLNEQPPLETVIKNYEEKNKLRQEIFAAPPQKEVDVESAVKKIQSVNPHKSKSKSNKKVDGNSLEAINEQTSNEVTLDNELSKRGPITGQRGPFLNELPQNDTDQGMTQLDRDIEEFERAQKEGPLQAKSSKLKASKTNHKLKQVIDADDDWEAQFEKDAQKDKLKSQNTFQESPPQKIFNSSQTGFSDKKPEKQYKLIDSDEENQRGGSVHKQKRTKFDHYV